MAAAIDYLADVAANGVVDLSRVSVVGHSAGGHLALWAVAEPNLSGGARYAVVEGDADDIVPERFARPDRPGTHTSRVKFVLIPGADHFDVIDPGHEAWTAAVAELAP